MSKKRIGIGGGGEDAPRSRKVLPGRTALVAVQRRGREDTGYPTRPLSESVRETSAPSCPRANPSVSVVKGMILVSEKGYKVVVLRIRRRDDKPDELVLGSTQFQDDEGNPLKLNGLYTMDDVRSGKLRAWGSDKERE